MNLRSGIHVVGSDPSDYQAPDHDHDEQPARALSRAEVERLRGAIMGLRYVGWRPFKQEGLAWKAALDHTLNALETVIASEPSESQYWIPEKTDDDDG